MISKYQCQIWKYSLKKIKGRRAGMGINFLLHPIPNRTAQKRIKLEQNIN